MLLLEMSHWVWTWVVWGRVRYGLMDSTLEDIGLHGHQMDTATSAATLGHTGHQSVRVVAANQPNAGRVKFTNILFIRNSLVLLNTVDFISNVISEKCLSQVSCATVLVTANQESVGNI